MTNIYCVRAEYGKYAAHFVRGGYVAMPWDVDKDLSAVRSIDDLRSLYNEQHPKTKGIVAEQYIGQIARFLFDLKPNDLVITPSHETEHIYHGTIKAQPYYYNRVKDGCPFPHRRPVLWDPQSIPAAEFSDAFQKNMRSLMTIFQISQTKDFLSVINRNRFTKEDLKT
jgi:predicted Mrr-cat superfamily restriction endonuclease